MVWGKYGVSHGCPGGHIKKEKSTGGIYSNNTCYLTHYIPHVISPTRSRYQKAGRRFFILCLHYNFRIQYPVSTSSTAPRQQATAPGPQGHMGGEATTLDSAGMDNLQGSP